MLSETSVLLRVLSELTQWIIINGLLLLAMMCTGQNKTNVCIEALGEKIFVSGYRAYY